MKIYDVQGRLVSDLEDFERGDWIIRTTPWLTDDVPSGVYFAVLQAGAISFVAAVVGALGAVRQAVRLQPAEAMRPEAPAAYRTSWIERAGLQRLFTQPTRMILRNLQRRPWRATLSVVGIAFGGAMLIVGSFGLDAMDLMMDLQFNVAQRHDLMVSFVEPRSADARHAVEPGSQFHEIVAKYREFFGFHGLFESGAQDEARRNLFLLRVMFEVASQTNATHLPFTSAKLLEEYYSQILKRLDASARDVTRGIVSVAAELYRPGFRRRYPPPGRSTG